MTTYPELVRAPRAQSCCVHHHSQEPPPPDSPVLIPPSASQRMSSDHYEIGVVKDDFLDGVNAVVVVGRWKAGLFECFSDGMPTAVLAACFPCVSLAQITHRIGLYRYNSTLLCFGLLWTIGLFFIIMQMYHVITLSKEDDAIISGRMCDSSTTTTTTSSSIQCPYCPGSAQNC